ncbi:hypothetical protein [Paenibacillus sp. MMS20-IR301]|uniref:hypothetical protein n=1 Tax=Paenibacillus sp. MMS20-IR301 TaxID=2895946 RepID=UPI0028F06A9A|nr:hypothetical protein [Paenibacillus sp. MMS20-IR301]WNS44733.1 hypothetical protein LOS79_05510 [Paenibacillus sp. MMS20-IR301]
MTDLNLAQSFALVALNAQSSLYMTNAKKVSLRSIAAAVVLEAYLEGYFTQEDNKLFIRKEALDQSSSTLYRETVLLPLLHNHAEMQGDLGWCLKKASMLPNKKLKELEIALADDLKAMNLLEEIPSLLGSDMYFDSAGVEMKAYRSHNGVYTSITENLRAEILEEGTVTDEIIGMLWLLRESGCMHDFFSRNELEQINTRMHDLYVSNLWAKSLFRTQIHHGFELGVKQFLQLKSKLVKTSAGSSINFFFPFLERSQAVFIETEAWFDNSNKRLNFVLARLTSYGHEVTVIEKGSIATLKIDNLLYDVIPHFVMMKVPIQGVRLVPKRPL